MASFRAENDYTRISINSQNGNVAMLIWQHIGHRHHELMDDGLSLLFIYG